MEYKLKNQIEIFDSELKDYVKRDTLLISFKGIKGLSTIKRMQDLIFKSFMEQSGKATATKEEKEENKNITLDDAFMMLEVTGNSEKIFSEVMKSLSEYATLDGSKLASKDIEEIEIEDLNCIYEGVLKSFLLVKVTSILNSMNK